LSVALHDIKDSINYAERIQRAMMPVQEKIREYLSTSFILFRPRDVVSGDFYWFNHKDGVDYIAAVDCTGHGVPGAFMSMVGSSLLNEIVLTKGINDPGQILMHLNVGVQNALKQRENKTRDGMDLAFCAINWKEKSLVYAGANRSLWIVRNGESTSEVEEIKATKCAIGGFTDESQIYTRHDINLKPGDTVYMHSDGYADQFGGPQGKKLMTKRFKDILLNIRNYEMVQQGNHLGVEIDEWMGGTYEQVDDILIIGVRF
jgi:serine phosphatase RsbU (regulator of sigma subunit)